MTPCACDKWRELQKKSDSSYGEDECESWFDYCDRMSYAFCPFCGKSLSGSEKPREEAEWRVMGEHECPNGSLGDEVYNEYNGWSKSSRRGDSSIIEINEGRPELQYRTKRPLPIQPEE